MIVIKNINPHGMTKYPLKETLSDDQDLSDYVYTLEDSKVFDQDVNNMLKKCYPSSSSASSSSSCCCNTSEVDDTDNDICTNIAYINNKVAIEVALPGYKAKNLSITKQANVLTIRAFYEFTNIHYTKQDIKFPNVEHKIKLPPSYAYTTLKSKFEDGLLTILIDYAEPAIHEVKLTAVGSSGDDEGWGETKPGDGLCTDGCDHIVATFDDIINFFTEENSK